MFMVFAEVWPGAFVGVILGKRTFGWMEHHAELDYVRCSLDRTCTDWFSRDMRVFAVVL